jgi:hypothetical protein
MWTGYGEYKMSVGLMPTFQPTDRILFAVNIAPFFDFPVDDRRDFCHLLEPFGARDHGEKMYPSRPVNL